jgi:hypothetical protein
MEVEQHIDVMATEDGHRARDRREICAVDAAGRRHQEPERNTEPQRVEAVGGQEVGVVVIEAVGGGRERREFLDEVHPAQHHDATRRIREPPADVSQGRDRPSGSGAV